MIHRRSVRAARRIWPLVVSLAVALGVSTVATVATAAAPPHQPFGHIDRLAQSPDGISIGGWAIDPDTTSPIHVDVYVDGHGTRLTAGNSRPDLARRYPYGPGHGFSATLPANQGQHSVCVYAINVGTGRSVKMACRTVEISFNVVGRVESIVQTTTGFAISGWALDPNTVGPIHVDVYVDGHGTRLTADGLRPDIAARYPGYGAAHGFKAGFPAGQGPHALCIYAINTGAGAPNLKLTCQTIVLQFNPYGRLDRVRQSSSGVAITGWAVDPNTTVPINVDVYIDGTFRSRVTANAPRPDVARAHPGVSADHGFVAQLSLVEGRHTVCTYGINVGLGGANPRLGCLAITIDYKPTSALDTVTMKSPGVHVTGWSVDPDTVNPIRVAISANGLNVGTFLANGHGSSRPGHAFDGVVRLNNGTYTVCASGMNVLQGQGTPMSSCKTISVNFDPIGSFDGVRRDATGGTAYLQGWAIDPDMPTTPLSVAVTIDGQGVANALANAARPDVARKYPGTGATHGLSVRYPVDAHEHKICVTALNRGNGISKPLGCRILNALHPVPPSAPRNVAATGGYASATVTWSAPTDDGGAPWTRYSVTSSPSGGSTTVGPGTTRATILGLKPRTVYRFLVVATNVAGNSAQAVSPAISTQASPPPQTTPAPISTSRYIRNITGGSSTDLAKMRAEGAADARANPSGHRYLILLDIGGQDQAGGGVLLSATTRFVSYANLAKDVNAYADGYASQQRPNAPVTIAIGTNNDMDVSASSGAGWARSVVNPVVAHSAVYHGITIAGANDFEPGFRGTYLQSRAWLQGYLAATRAPFVFNGSADGCAWTAIGRGCNNGWTMSGLYYLATGAFPTRLVNLPQIYNNTMAAQWKYISLTGVSQSHPKINFGGALTEWTACYQTRSCGSLTGNNAWTQMWRQLQSHPALRVNSLPYSTDLRIDR